MTITERVLDILLLLRTVKYATTSVIREWCVPNDRDGSVTREIMRKMIAAGFVRRYKAQIVDPLASSTAPVFVPTQSGCSVLATTRKDMSLLLDYEPLPTWQQFPHYVEVGKFCLTFRASLVKSNVATLAGMFLEHDVINRDEADPAKRFKTYTIVKEGTEGRRIVCVPDALFGIQVGKFLTSYYLELERGTDSPARIAAKKSPGYAGLAETGKFKDHLPSGKMRVIAVCPNAAFRMSLQKEMRNKPGKDLWRFVSREDLRVDSILHAPILYTCEGEAIPLVRTPVGTPMAEAGTE